MKLADDDIAELRDAVAQIDHRSGGQSQALERQAEQIAVLERRMESVVEFFTSLERQPAIIAHNEQHSRKVGEA